MKAKQKTVYYCDYCKKKGMIAYHIENHEKHCTMNPERQCGVCADGIDLPEAAEAFRVFFVAYEKENTNPPTWNNLLAEYKESYSDKEIEENLMNFGENCPACSLAILRQSKVGWYFAEYKTLLHRFMSERWAEETAQYSCGSYC